MDFSLHQQSIKSWTANTQKFSIFFKIPNDLNAKVLYSNKILAPFVRRALRNAQFDPLLFYESSSSFPYSILILLEPVQTGGARVPPSTWVEEKNQYFWYLKLGLAQRK